MLSVSKRSFVSRVLSVGALLGLSSPVLAGTSVTIFYSPTGMPVPAIGGFGLVALALVLSVVGVRVLRRSGGEGAKFLLSAVGVAALVSGAAGVKLISDAQAVATPTAFLTNDAGGSVQLTEFEGCYPVENDSNVPHSITNIVPQPGWSYGPCLAMMNGGNGGNGGVFRGTCSDSPSTYMEPGDYCTLELSFDLE